MINIVVPMAGRGSRFVKAGYETPKPFIDVSGKPMITRVIENLKYPDAKYILIAQEKHLEDYKDVFDNLKKSFDIEIIPINIITEGTACTALFARKYINNDTPLMIANSDQIVDIDIGDFINDMFKRKLDGSILTFKDKYKDPKWSFAKVNEDGYVIEVKEKVPISDTATVGIYLWNKGKYFVNSAIDMIVRNDRVNGEFYVCPTYNYCIKEGLKIGVYNIEFEQMHGTGTPEDLQEYLKFLNSKEENV